ncbi:hypothetical protein Mapa_009780 [Marchantia paleacea]|nr:hypothetical protein Mapa_009780 [Marchantia paleacea]
MDAVLPPASGCLAVASWRSSNNSPRFSDRAWLRSSTNLVPVAPLKVLKSSSLHRAILRTSKAGISAEATVATEDEVEDMGNAATAASEDVVRSVELLKTAARTRKVPASEICASFRTLEKAKLDRSNYASIIGGTESPGRTWMLVFTVNKDVYNNKAEGGGSFFPVTAVQNFDTAAQRLENGIYLRQLGNLTFSGKLKFEKRKLSFFVNFLNLTVGQYGPLRIKLGGKGDDGVPDKDDPFFIWYYADDDIIVAKGRGGGVAYWCRCSNAAKR